MRIDAMTPIGPAEVARPSVVCTSEADAFHLFLAAGHVINVAASEGPASRRPDPDALAVFAEAHPLLILAGPGEAGERIAAALTREVGFRTCRLALPAGRHSVADLRERGEVLPWLASEWARFGSPWPPGMLERHEAAMTNDPIAPETTRNA